jgi:hypothetical protein
LRILCGLESDQTPLAGFFTLRGSERNREMLAAKGKSATGATNRKLT